MTLKPLMLAGLLALASLCAPARAAKDPITIETEQAFWWGDFDALEAANAKLKQERPARPDGASELELFRVGLSNVIHNEGKHGELYLQELEALTLQWATEHPRSALAHTLYAATLVAHGWSYRGGGYVKDVPPEAWCDFHAYLGRAFDYLMAHGDVALTDSYAHATLISIGKGLSWDGKQMRAIAEDGLKRNPRDINLYFDLMITLLPKWGGDPKRLDQFIRSATDQTRAEFGTGMYSRLYSYAAEQEYGHTLFENSYVDWDKMKQSYKDMLERYPDSHGRRNRYAYMACLAKDKATLLALLDELGPRLDAANWGPNPERSLESCQRWARQL